MTSKVRVFSLLSLCIMALFVITSLPYLTIKWVAAASVILTCILSVESVVSRRRRAMNFTKIFFMLASLGCFTSLLFNPSQINFSIFMFSHILMALQFYRIQGDTYNENECLKARYQIPLKANLFLLGNRVEADVLDISSSGCLLETSENVNIDECLQVEIYYNHIYMRVSGKVVRKASSNSFGLQFLGLDQRKFKNFDEAINYLLIETGTQSSLAKVA